MTASWVCKSLKAPQPSSRWCSCPLFYIMCPQAYNTIFWKTQRHYSSWKWTHRAQNCSLRTELMCAHFVGIVHFVLQRMCTVSVNCAYCACCQSAVKLLRGTVVSGGSSWWYSDSQWYSWTNGRPYCQRWGRWLPGLHQPSPRLVHAREGTPPAYPYIPRNTP